MPLQATSGAASYDAFGGGAAVAPKYIEDFFQTWLRTGTGSSATVTTGLNASINKSLVWSKSRSAATNHKLTDTVRGATKALSSNTTSAEATDSQGLTAFSSTGYTIGTNTDYNNSGATYVDWQWLATPKFFDVVTYTGTGSARTVAHNLGSAPGFMLIKQTSGTEDWVVYHRSLGAGFYMSIRTTDPALDASAAVWNFTAPTATQFTVGSASALNASGQTYVAYLFAHNAGGFGLTGTDNVISCGSFTTNSSGNLTAAIDLGYEPQWVLYKQTNSANGWSLLDNMRGMPVTGDARELVPNTSGAESGTSTPLRPTATGLTGGTGIGDGTFIYVAIRRGPMKVPTTGTSVFAPVTYAGNDSTQNLPTGFVADSALIMPRNAAGATFYLSDRLRGPNRILQTQSTAAEANGGTYMAMDQQNGVTMLSATYNASGLNFVLECFRRAPGFFDEVCYTGTGANRTVAHNLAAVPELMIVKSRSLATTWAVYAAPLGNTKAVYLDQTSAEDVTSRWNNTTPTSSVFSVNNNIVVNDSGATYVAYLFASCSGVSKVTNFTGTGALQTINCGFTSGARFVLIKRTDSTGNWFVWDSSRGLSSSNDPYLLLNSTAAEVTSTNWVDTTSTGFQVTAASGNDVNISGASYIALAIS